MANPMIAVLKYYGAPVNRHEYLNTAYMGKPPAKLDPESEAELPQDDVRFMPERYPTHEEQAAEEAEKTGGVPDIVIGGGAKGTEQKGQEQFMNDQKFLDRLDDEQYGEKRKSNII